MHVLPGRTGSGTHKLLPEEGVNVKKAQRYKSSVFGCVMTLWDWHDAERRQQEQLSFILSLYLL